MSYLLKIYLRGSFMANDIQVQGNDYFYMILKAAMNVPGVHINRNDFLRKELSKNFDRSIVDLAIQKNPASAGIKTDTLERIANACIKYESNKVTLLSAAAGIPGGVAMFGTVPADMAQYFAHIVRILQKLIYLYGWQDIYNEDGEFDDATLNQLTLFIGVMFGVNAANAVVKKLADSAARHAEKTLARKALTKGAVYPIVKKVATMIGVKMNKEIFAKSVGKIVPGLGGLVSGTITYATFKPLAVRLKEYLQTLPIADTEFYKQGNNDVIDIDFTDIDVSDDE